MEYLSYLEPASQAVQQLVAPLVRIVEDGPPCRQSNIFGQFHARRREVTICTSTIRKYPDARTLINDTLMHEATHVAQACQSGFRHVTPFGIQSRTMTLTAQRESDLARLLKSRPELSQIDREAFFFEDKPNLVRYVLRKYCR